MKIALLNQKSHNTIINLLAKAYLYERGSIYRRGRTIL